MYWLHWNCVTFESLHWGALLWKILLLFFWFSICYLWKLCYSENFVLGCVTFENFCTTLKTALFWRTVLIWKIALLLKNGKFWNWRLGCVTIEELRYFEKLHYFWKIENFETESWGALLLETVLIWKTENFETGGWGALLLKTALLLKIFALPWKLRYFENLRYFEYCVSFEKLRYFEKLSYCKRKVLRWGALLLTILYYFVNFTLLKKKFALLWETWHKLYISSIKRHEQYIIILLLYKTKYCI